MKPQVPIVPTPTGPTDRSTGGAAADDALFELGSWLRAGGYSFVTPTPATHQRVNTTRALRSGQGLAGDLRDVFGWSLRFRADLLPEALLRCLELAGELRREAEHYRSAVRFSSLAGKLFVHSAFPTVAEDAVFFGPDTYRFAAFVARSTEHAVERAVEIGCGTGAAGLVLPHTPKELVLCDVNERALRYTRINARLAGRNATIVHSDVLGSVAGSFDLIIANPPYMRDAGGADLSRRRRQPRRSAVVAHRQGEPSAHVQTGNVPVVHGLRHRWRP